MRGVPIEEIQRSANAKVEGFAQLKQRILAAMDEVDEKLDTVRGLVNENVAS